MAGISKEPLRHFLMDEVQRLSKELEEVTSENLLLKAQLDEISQGIDILTPYTDIASKMLSKQGAVRPSPMV